MVQVDLYRRDAAFRDSFAVDGARLYAVLTRIAGRRLESATTFVLGQVAVMRVDLGAAGFAVLEHMG